jgi:methylthioribose-1-phosphate isomerase
MRCDEGSAIPADPSGPGRRQSLGMTYARAMVPTVAWEDGVVVMIDQRRLPAEQVFLRCRDHHEVAAAIRDMAIRGAPAIGVAAALGLALGARTTQSEGAALLAEWSDMCATLAATRPTAVNLFWAIERMRRRFRAFAAQGGATLRAALLDEALAIQQEDLEACRRMGDLGAELLPAEARVLTHCNAGALATAGYGTALGVIRSAARLGKVKAVFADETRPWLQGARLTAWELLQDGIPTTVITDSMAGHLMARGEINAVVVGSDRIAANGDVANKIGTYTVAVLAKEHGIPFYVAAPVSTFDLGTPTGGDIPIEERPAEEVTHVAGRRVAPEGAAVRNPAFDVTPHRYVTAVVCERGVARPPFAESLRALAGADPSEER